MITRRSAFHFDDVEYETLLLVEGIEDARFFNAILRQLGRTNVQTRFPPRKDLPK